MRFELVVPHTDKHSADDIFAMFNARLETRISGDWPVIPEKYVAFGDDFRAGEIDLSQVAGELRSLPEKKDGKWLVDVVMYDNKPGKEVTTLAPYLKKAGAPMKVALAVFYDGEVVTGPFCLRFVSAKENA